MAEIEHVGGGTFVDSDPVAGPEGTTDDPDVYIYPYAYFRSLEHVAYGLFRTTGGPKDEEIDSVEVGDYGMEPKAQLWDFDDALEALEKGEKWAFEETPEVEVKSKKDYMRALDALDIDPEDEHWERAGVYDFRDEPPTFIGTVEEYELDSLKYEAEQAFDFMFQGDEWEEAWRELAEAEE